MKILKHGVQPKTNKIFICQNCECEFEAEKGEYRKLMVCSTDGVEATFCACCECTECGEVAKENT